MRFKMRYALFAFAMLLFGCLTALPARAGKAIADISVVFSCSPTNSMYISAQVGILRAYTELGVPIRVYTCDYNEKTFRSTLETAAKHSKLVIAIGGDLESSVNRVAALYGKIDFVLIDGRSSAPNVTSVMFRQNEGSYLAGMLAAISARQAAGETGAAPAVGIILGEKGKESPVMLDFLAGFEQGVRSVSADMPILKRSVQSWNDPKRAKIIAAKMNRDGALIIYQAAGRSGQGVIEAGVEHSFCVIGVDEPQERIAPGIVLTAMIKHFDKAVFDAIVARREGRLSRGDLLFYGLDDGGVALSWTSNTLIPDDTKRLLDEAAAQIISGQIVVDSCFNGDGSLKDGLAPLEENQRMK